VPRRQDDKPQPACLRPPRLVLRSGPGLGSLRVDVAYGGMTYVLVTRSTSASICGRGNPRAVRAGQHIRVAAAHSWRFNTPLTPTSRYHPIRVLARCSATPTSTAPTRCAHAASRRLPRAGSIGPVRLWYFCASGGPACRGESSRVSCCGRVADRVDIRRVGQNHGIVSAYPRSCRVWRAAAGSPRSTSWFSTPLIRFRTATPRATWTSGN
jgi:hypothetical protein